MIVLNKLCMGEAMFEKIETVKKIGSESFSNGVSMLEFWSWAHSDILGNAERGILAEFIVAMALHATDKCRTEWDAYDVLTNEGIKIEVKSAAYLQVWEQRNYSKIQFGIKTTNGWDANTNTYSPDKKRQADVYIFSLFKCKDQRNANPMDFSQWDFYVVSTKVLNEKYPNQKSLSLAGLKRLGVEPIAFEQISKTVKDIYLKDIK